MAWGLSGLGDLGVSHRGFFLICNFLLFFSHSKHARNGRGMDGCELGRALCGVEALDPGPQSSV
jgi:hypothetical protein